MPNSASARGHSSGTSSFVTLLTLSSLPAAGRLDLAARSGGARAYSGPILASVLYPIIPFMAEPTVAMCDCFFSGDMKGAWEAGRFSSREALSGIYRMFVVMGSPHTILKKGANAMAQLYQPSAITYIPGEGSRGVLRITTFPEPHRVLDARFGGFVEESLVICGCKNPVVSMGHMMSQGHPHSEYHITWG